MKKNKGITIVSLVITIIVALILIGVTVNLTISDTGLFSNAKNSIDKYKISKYEDCIGVAILKVYQTDVLEGIDEIERLEAIQKELKKNELFKNSSYKIQKYEEEDSLIIITSDGYGFVVGKDEYRYIDKIEQMEEDLEIIQGKAEFICNPEGYTNENVLVQVNIIKEELKKYKVEYTMDLNNWTLLKRDEKIIVEENNTTIYARLTNEIISGEEIISITITNIDKEKPEITGVEESSISWNGATGTVIITAKAKDAGSGIDAYQISDKDNLTENSSGWTNIQATTEEITFKQEGIQTGTYYIYVKDQAGNIVKRSKGITVGDTTLPEISLTANKTEWTNEDITLTGVSQDTESGLVGCAWTDNANTPTKWEEIEQTTKQITKTTTVSSNGTKYFWTKDGVGNINVASITIDKIDKTSPDTPSISIVDISINSGNWKYSILVQGASDSQSKINNYEYVLGTTTSTSTSSLKTITGTSNPNYTIKVRVQDNAGNYSAYSNVMTLNINRLYIRQLYQALRSGGAGSEGEITSWENQLANDPMTRIAYNIFTSTEASNLYTSIGKEKMLERLYNGILGRGVDSSGYNNFIPLMSSNKWFDVSEKVLLSIVNSSEAQNIYINRGMKDGKI